MGKFLESFKFEVILFIVGMCSVIVVACLKHAGVANITPEFEIGLGIAGALVPLALARIESIVREDREKALARIESVVREDREKSVASIVAGVNEPVQQMLSHCAEIADQEFVARRRELAVSTGFVLLLDKVFQHGADCVHVLHEVQALVRDVSEGRYPISDPSHIYYHDAKRISLLEKGDFYWATWSASANPDAFAKNNPSSVAYETYTNAQIAAAGKGVNVVRLYIVPEPSNLPDSLSQHIRRLKDGGVSVGLVSADLLRNEPFCEDFVIIGHRVVGLGDPLRGPMKRSIYYFNTQNAVRNEYQTYKDFFEALRGSAVEVS